MDLGPLYKLDIFGTLLVKVLGILLLFYHIKFGCPLRQALHRQPRKSHNADEFKRKETCGWS